MVRICFNHFTLIYYAFLDRFITTDLGVEQGLNICLVKQPEVLHLDLVVLLLLPYSRHQHLLLLHDSRMTAAPQMEDLLLRRLLIVVEVEVVVQAG